MIRSFANLAVVPTPPPTYGCLKPTTTSTLNNFRITGGAHDLTYSYVKFTGDVTGVGSHATTGMLISASYPGDIHDITFDHCVFASDTYAGGQSNAFHAIFTQNVIYNITFSNCWFEPYSRFGFEWNGRGGWSHDITIDHCTFEGGLGEVLSFDMSPNNATPNSPYGVNVAGVVRGVEGLHITNNLIEGTGTPNVGGFTYPLTSATSGRMGLEFGCVYPYSANNAVGRSEFSGNKVGRCYSAWYQTNYSGASYMTFEDNVFDDTYNPHGCTVRASTAFSGVSASHCAFTGNTYVLGNHSTVFVSGYSGTANSYSGEDWTKSGSITASFPFTSSTYEACHFHAGNSATIATGSTRDAACVGFTGGTLV